MPGKRKRDTAPGVAGYMEIANIKPISAIAAAKLKSQPQPINTGYFDGTQDEGSSSPATATDPPSRAFESSEPEFEDAISEDELPDFRPNVQMCNWRYGVGNVAEDTYRGLTVSLQAGEDIALIGVFDFIVLKGAININGANFAATQPLPQNTLPRRVYVPCTHPISVIRALDDSNMIQFLHCEDTPKSFASISPLLAGIWNERPSGLPSRSFALIPESGVDPLNRNLRPEYVPSDWTRELEDCANNSSVTLICGAPSSGKSTFARRLQNRYLTGHGKLAPALSSVYFLDLDPEHPEYSPHGQISLTLVREINLGPSYTHPTSIPGSSGGNETIRSHAIPLGNFANFQEYFISCLENLYHTYTELQERNPSIPLIINIPGWVYTTSFNILLRMLSRATPQRLVHLRDLDTIDEERAIKFHNLNSEAARNRISVREISAHKSLIAPLRTEDELRSMQMLSYFHCTGQVTELETARFDYDYKPLSNMTPWEFHYKETENSNQTFVGFLNLAEWVEPRHLFTALNGSIIQIIETEDENVQDLFGELPRTNKYRIPYFDKGPNEAVEPLDPQSSRLVCTALLRGWDPENRVAQLLVPKTHEVLLHGLKPEKTVLVFGCCDTPEWAFTEDAYYNAAERKMDGEAGDQLVCGDVELPPWVARDEEVKSMGYLNAVRRIRKYQQ